MGEFLLLSVKRQFRFILPAVRRKAFRSCVIRRFHLQRHDPVQAVFQEKVNLGTVAASPIIRPNPKSGQFCHTVVLGESTFKRCISFRLSQNSAVSYACISAQEAKVRPICLEKGCVRAGGKRDLRSRYHLQTISGAPSICWRGARRPVDVGFAPTGAERRPAMITRARSPRA